MVQEISFQPAGPAGDGEIQVVSARCLTSLEAHRDRSSLLHFHKIHSGAVSIEKKDKFLTPAHTLKTTRASHIAQYCRYQTYSDALKNSFFPELFHSGMVFLLRSTEEFRALLI